MGAGQHVSQAAMCEQESGERGGYGGLYVGPGSTGARIGGHPGAAACGLPASHGGCVSRIA